MTVRPPTPRRQHLPAVVGPLAARQILLHLRGALEKVASDSERAGEPHTAAQVRMAIASMVESDRQFRASLRRPPPFASPRGEGEGGNRLDGARSVEPTLMGGVPSAARIRTAEVAEMLRVSPRTARDLHYAGRLSATKEGRDLWFDLDSVNEYRREKEREA